MGFERTEFNSYCAAPVVDYSEVTLTYGAYPVGMSMPPTRIERSSANACVKSVSRLKLVKRSFSVRFHKNGERTPP